MTDTFPWLLARTGGAVDLIDRSAGHGTRPARIVDLFDQIEAKRLDPAK